MGQRLQLQTLLEEIQGNDSVYFQPTTNTGMDYPCILYNVADLNTDWANNETYNQIIEWQVVVIDRNPDNDIWRKVGRLPLSSMTRTAVVENLYHYYFTLYF